MYNWLNIIQNYLLPPTCILCGHAGWQNLDLCYSCYAQLPENKQCCIQCARPLNTEISLCGECLSRPPAFDASYAPYSYQGAMRYMILGLKSGAEYKNARTLGLLLAKSVQNTPLPDCILPVPLHKARYKQRCFNQVIEIARTVGKELQRPLDLTSCIRHRDTPHQTKLSAKQRRKNIKNAFTVVKPIHAQHIAIIDDVMTTGSTVHELARVLKKAGVARVDVWVCARAK